uniref:Uncharacterized protein n=1 Tax=Timema monikensis TaxID=170555 RepID=A0A7R9HKH8_9NEOP|nr:unnamed protein product [Timema monikensis]
MASLVLIDSSQPTYDSQHLVTKFIRIGITDKNDSPPYFDKALYETEVDENEELHHTVLTVTAKDDHEGEYSSFKALNKAEIGDNE